LLSVLLILGIFNFTFTLGVFTPDLYTLDATCVEFEYVLSLIGLTVLLLFGVSY